MNQEDKIKTQTEKGDESPTLKVGEIKSILIAEAYKTLPDFEFRNYHRNCYTFQRIKQLGNDDIYETLHIAFSLKGGSFACSVASRINPNLVTDNSYNNGLLNPHKDLIVLKKTTGKIPAEEACYFHNGRVATTTEVVAQIFKDYKQFGITFLNKQFDIFINHEIIKEGLAYVERLAVDENILKEELEYSLKNCKQQISSIKHPVYIDLKETLQSISAQTRDDRKQIPKLAYELLELYCGRK